MAGGSIEMPGVTKPVAVRTYFSLPSIRDTSIVSMPSTWLASRSTASAGTHLLQGQGSRLQLSEGMGRCTAYAWQDALLLKLLPALGVSCAQPCSGAAPTLHIFLPLSISAL